MKLKCVAFAIAGCQFSSMVSADLDGRAIALSCVSCHSEAGRGMSNTIPALKDLSHQQIQQALLDFKYDKKPATVMPRLVKGFSDEELRAVVEYLARE